MKIIARPCRFSAVLDAMLLVSAVPASAIDGIADKVRDPEHYKPDEKDRWMVVVFYKEGRADADPSSPWVHNTGVTLNRDHGRYFAGRERSLCKPFKQPYGESGGGIQVLRVSC